ncbi:hypothetical protein ACFPK1_29735 [Actinomycetospora rhizophila]|uniref:Uncharacterized protein n=1 Tax=Actinomycetospora rhizophila TaxID=1416876 RepID=A0ABV9ZQ91_9PSEU
MLLVASAVVVTYTVLAVDVWRRVYGRRLRSNPLAAAFQMPVESSQDTDMKLTRSTGASPRNAPPQRDRWRSVTHAGQRLAHHDRGWYTDS